MIESTQNKLIKELRALGDKKHRDESGLFIADGFRFVSEIPENTKINKMVFSESFSAISSLEAFSYKAIMSYTRSSTTWTDPLFTSSTML